MTDKYDVYEAEGELLDLVAQCAVNERPFYLQKELDSLTNQVHLLDNITEEAQADYFATALVRYQHTPVEMTAGRVLENNNYAEREEKRKKVLAEFWSPEAVAARRAEADANPITLQPYISTGRCGGSWDNHEVHSYTADGE